MFEARVVENHVHHHLQPFLMGLVAQLTIVVVRTKAGVNTIVVRGGIAVIGRVAALVVRRVVFQDWRQPKGRHT